VLGRFRQFTHNKGENRNGDIGKFRKKDAHHQLPTGRWNSRLGAAGAIEVVEAISDSGAERRSPSGNGFLLGFTWQSEGSLGWPSRTGGGQATPRPEWILRHRRNGAACSTCPLDV
jgi:hypothetical protein